MAVLILKLLADLSKQLDPLDGTNYKHWSYKLLNFFGNGGRRNEDNL